MIKWSPSSIVHSLTLQVSILVAPKKGSNRDEMYEYQEDQYEALDGVSRTNSEEKMAQLNQDLEENQPKAPVPQKFLDIRDQRLRDSEDRQLHET